MLGAKGFALKLALIAKEMETDPRPFPTTLAFCTVPRTTRPRLSCTSTLSAATMGRGRLCSSVVVQGALTVSLFLCTEIRPRIKVQLRY